MRQEGAVVCWVRTSLGACLALLLQWVCSVFPISVLELRQIEFFCLFLKVKGLKTFLHLGFPVPALRGEGWQQEHHIHCMDILGSTAVTLAGLHGCEVSRWAQMRVQPKKALYKVVQNSTVNTQWFLLEYNPLSNGALWPTRGGETWGGC